LSVKETGHTLFDMSYKYVHCMCLDSCTLYNSNRTN